MANYRFCAILPVLTFLLDGLLSDTSQIVDSLKYQEVSYTSGLIVWLENQCEQMTNEIDAILHLESDKAAKRFSLVNYVNFVSLYNQLAMIANKTDHIDSLAWVGKKVKAYSVANVKASEILANYLEGLDHQMEQIEARERRDRQEAVKSEWVSLYETIRYVANHTPDGSTLRSAALGLLTKSPDKTEDKQRSLRYSLFIRVN